MFIRKIFSKIIASLVVVTCLSSSVSMDVHATELAASATSHYTTGSQILVGG